MRLNKKAFDKDESRREQQRLKEEFSKAIKDATTLNEDDDSPSDSENSPTM